MAGWLRWLTLSSTVWQLEKCLVYVRGVLVLIADQVPDTGGDETSGPVVLQKLRGPPLQVIKVRAAFPLEQVPVPLVTTAQGCVEWVP